MVMASVTGVVVVVSLELVCLRNSRVKGHHAIRSNTGIGDSFVCERERSNAYSDVAISNAHRKCGYAGRLGVSKI